MSDPDVRAGAGLATSDPAPDAARNAAVAQDPWGRGFRDGWRGAPAAGRRRAAQLAVGLPRFALVAEPGLRIPLSPPPSPETWAAGVHDDGTFAAIVEAAPRAQA